VAVWETDKAGSTVGSRSPTCPPLPMVFAAVSPCPHPAVFRLADPVPAAVARHNAVWQARWERFLAATPPPRWEPPVPLDAEWRMRYETYLPVVEYVASLRRLARLVLPHPSWIPLALGATVGHLSPRTCFSSLPDLWSYLPPAWCGRVTLTTEELPALFAALADPTQFGTAAGRYPNQLTLLRERRWPAVAVLLDVGCGTGEGTREAVAAIRETGCPARGIGVTREPLEAWMATAGWFPHRLSARTPPLPGVQFVAGEAAALPVRGPIAAILCNGLIGGRFVQSETAFRGILAEFARVLAPGGIVLVGCRFHAGRENALMCFRRQAEATGWRVSGDSRDLVLCR